MLLSVNLGHGRLSYGDAVHGRDDCDNTDKNTDHAKRATRGHTAPALTCPPLAAARPLGEEQQQGEGDQGFTHVSSLLRR